jgi:hypothetical protein
MYNIETTNNMGLPGMKYDFWLVFIVSGRFSVKAKANLFEYNTVISN